VSSGDTVAARRPAGTATRTSAARTARALLGRGLFYAAAFGFVGVFAFPYYWMAMTALKLPGELYVSPPRYWPSQLYLTNLVVVFTERPFATYVRNSAVIATMTTVFCVVVGAFSAYAIARLPIRFKPLILGAILTVTMFPRLSVVGPIFMMLRDLGWIDTYQGLFVPYAAFSLPFTMWVLVNFFRQLPRELEEAAEIDGCTPVQALVRVVVPLAAPAVATIAILVFISAWNEFLFAFIFSRSNAVRTVPVGIVMFQGVFAQVPWGEISAAATIVTLPLIVLVLVFQRRIVQGLTAGALKG
jgi:multiple sugar transport system permease protein